MPKGAPLVYTVSFEDSSWKVWKGGSLSGRPSKVFDRKRPAIEYAEQQANKYNAEGVIILTQSGRIDDVREAPHSFRTGKSIYRSSEAVIEVEWDDFGNFGWMIVSTWDNGLLGSDYGRKEDATAEARDLMEVIGVKKVIVRNRTDSGRQEHINPDVPDTWKIQGG